MEGSQEDPPVYLGNQDLRHYVEDFELELVGYIDSNWEGDSIDLNSNFRCVFMFGGGPIFFSRKNKAAIALASTKTEYRGAVNACIQVVWLQGIFLEFDFGSSLYTIIFCDNKSSINISRDPVTR